MQTGPGCAGGALGGGTDRAEIDGYGPGYSKATGCPCPRRHAGKSILSAEQRGNRGDSLHHARDNKFWRINITWRIRVLLSGLLASQVLAKAPFPNLSSIISIPVDSKLRCWMVMSYVHI